jgi:hypothetical protein
VQSKGIRNESDLSAKVAIFLQTKPAVQLGNDLINLRCMPVTTELKVGGIRFDAVGYSPSEGAFFLVESKLGTSEKDIGQAFGQILAYKAVIRESGKNFLREFFAKSRKGISPDDLERITSSRRISCRFLIALTDGACARYELIRWIQRTLKKTEQVGVIRYSKRSNKCREYFRVDGRREYEFFRNSPLQIPYRDVFANVREFLEETARAVRHSSRGKELLPSKPFSNIVQFRSGKTVLHYEIQVLKRAKRIEVALDVEPHTGNRKNDRRIKNAFISMANKRIRKSNAKQVKVKRDWLREGTWGRICYEIYFEKLDSDLAVTAARQLIRLRRILNPAVASFVS